MEPAFVVVGDAVNELEAGNGMVWMVVGEAGTWVAV